MLVVVADKYDNFGDFIYLGDAVVIPCHLTLLHYDQRYNPLTNRTSRILYMFFPNLASHISIIYAWHPHPEFYTVFVESIFAYGGENSIGCERNICNLAFIWIVCFSINWECITIDILLKLMSWFCPSIKMAVSGCGRFCFGLFGFCYHFFLS